MLPMKLRTLKHLRQTDTLVYISHGVCVGLSIIGLLIIYNSSLGFYVKIFSSIAIALISYIVIDYALCKLENYIDNRIANEETKFGRIRRYME